VKIKEYIYTNIITGCKQWN